jgi:hypothetical protein
LTNALDPKPVAAGSRRVQLEASTGSRDRSGTGVAAIIEQDDERFLQRRPIGLEDRAAEHLLGRQRGGDEECCQSSADAAKALQDAGQVKFHC